VYPEGRLTQFLPERGILTPGTFRHVFGYTDLVIPRKPSRKLGQDLRDLPLYSIPEAATFLAIPRRTMRVWFRGDRKLFTPAGDYRTHSLLSFKDLSEAYIVHILREVHGLSMSSIRHAIEALRKESKSRNPLTLDIKLFAKHLILDRPPRGLRGREAVDLSNSRQLALTEVIDLFGQRILQDATGKPIALYPWRMFVQDHESRPLSIDPEVMSGKLVVFGTRIPASAVLGMKLSNRTTEDIASNYRLDTEAVTKVLRHFDKGPLLPKVA